MIESASLYFPFEYDNEHECLRRAHTIEETILSCIKCFLLTRKGSRVGTNFGSILPELVLQTVQFKKLKEFESEVLSELGNQFPGVSFLEVLFTRGEDKNKNVLFVDIKLQIPSNSNILDFKLTFPTAVI